MWNNGMLETQPRAWELGCCGKSVIESQKVCEVYSCAPVSRHDTKVVRKFESVAIDNQALNQYFLYL